MNGRRAKEKHRAEEARDAAADAALAVLEAETERLTSYGPPVIVDPADHDDIAELVRLRDHPTEAIGLLLGWAQEEEDQLEEVRRSTCAALVKALGTNRIGPVTWHQFHGPAAVDAVSCLVDGEPREAWLNLYRRTRALLREHPDSIVVITSAPGRPL